MKNLFKLFICMMLVSAMALCLAACGGGETPAQTKDYDVLAIADSIAQNVSFEDEYLTRVADVAFELNRDNIELDSIVEEDGVKQASVYVSGAYPEMIFSLKAVDEAAAQKAMAAIEEIIKNYTTNYTNYGPEQVSKLESAVKVQRGNYVFVIVSNDNAAASTYLEGLLG